MAAVLVKLVCLCHALLLVFAETPGIPAAFLQPLESGLPVDDAFPKDDTNVISNNVDTSQLKTGATSKGPDSSTLPIQPTQSPQSTGQSIKSSTSPNLPSTAATTTTTAGDIPAVFEDLPDEETVDEIFSEQCNKPAVINEYCVLPEDLKVFLGPDSTVEDIGQYLLSDQIVETLLSRCPPGEWCLTESVEEELDKQLTFWTNASDFRMLCWPDLAICLDYITDFYFDCDSYETHHLITAMDTLLCKMKEEPKASPDCIEQTLKTLHISMADSKRTFEELEDSDSASECDSRRSRMAKNFLCTTAMCDKYSAILYEFDPWVWVTDQVEELKQDCSLENMDCVARADEDTMDELLSSVIKDEEQVYEKNWLLEKFDMRAVIVIAIVSVAAMGAFSLVIFVFWRKRKMRVRVRDGMEYLEIKPEETEAFLEGMDEIGDTTRLVK